MERHGQLHAGATGATLEGQGLAGSGGSAVVPGRGLGRPHPAAMLPAAGVLGHPHFVPLAPRLRPHCFFLELDSLGPGFQKGSSRSRSAKASAAGACGT